MEQKPVSEFTVTELKAAVYDLLAQQEQIQRQIQAINQEIARKTPIGKVADDASITTKAE